MMTDPTLDPMYLPDKSTPLTLAEAIHAFFDGYVRAMGEDPKAECLAVIVAHSALETGNWAPGKIHCFSFGNIKKAADWTGKFTMYRCDEIFDAQTAHRAQQLGPCTVADWRGGPKKRVVLFPPHPWSAFRAHDSAEEGAEQHILFLATREHYKKAWHWICAGDAKQLVLALEAAGYFTGPADSYLKAVVSIAAKVLEPCRKVIAGEHHDLSDEDIAHVEGLVALSLYDSIRNADTEPAPHGVA